MCTDRPLCSCGLPQWKKEKKYTAEKGVYFCCCFISYCILKYSFLLKSCHLSKSKMTSSLLPARNADLTRTKCAERLVYKSPIAILSCSGFLVKVDCSYEAWSCAVLMILKEERWACLHKNFAWLRVSSWLYNCYLLCSNCFFICTLQNVTWKMSDFMKCEKWCWVPWVSSLWASLVIFKLFFFKNITKITSHTSFHWCRLVLELLRKEIIVWALVCFFPTTVSS